MQCILLLFTIFLPILCLHDGTVCDCPKPPPCPVNKCPIRNCAPSIVLSSKMLRTEARVRRLRNIKPISSGVPVTDFAPLKKVTLAPPKHSINSHFDLPKTPPHRVSSIVEDYPNEEELSELDRLPVVQVKEEVHQPLEESLGDLKIISSTPVPMEESTTIEKAASTIMPATKPMKKKRKHRKTTTTTEIPVERTEPVTEITITTDTEETTTRPPPAVTVMDSTEIKEEEEPREESTTTSTSVEPVSSTESTTLSTTDFTTESVTTIMPQSSSPHDLKGLDSIVADVSLPHMKKEETKNEVPVVSAGYKTNPQFAPEEVNVEEEKCNDDDLLKLLIEAMQIDDSNGSKRAIGALLSSGQTKFSTGQVSVMCTQHQMAFRLVARKYCQLTAGSATCIAFLL